MQVFTVQTGHMKAVPCAQASSFPVPHRPSKALSSAKSVFLTMREKVATLALQNLFLLK